MIAWITCPNSRSLNPSDEVAAAGICKRKRRLRMKWMLILWRRLGCPRASLTIRWELMKKREMMRRKSLRKKKRTKMTLMNKLRQVLGLGHKGSNLWM
jgi:hypothetical protein